MMVQRQRVYLGYSALISVQWERVEASHIIREHILQNEDLRRGVQVH